MKQDTTQQELQHLNPALHLSGYSLCPAVLSELPQDLSSKGKIKHCLPEAENMKPDYFSGCRVVLGVGTGCCSHTPLPQQQEHPGALRGLARQGAGLGLVSSSHGSMFCQLRPLLSIVGILR